MEKGADKVRLAARISDNHRIVQTDFFVDGQSVGSTADAEPSIEWTPVPGSHIIRAVVKDAAGNETSSKEVKITVQ